MKNNTDINTSQQYPRIKDSKSSPMEVEFGDWEKTLVGYAIYTQNGFHLTPVGNDQDDPTANVRWVSLADEDVSYVWTVEQVNTLISLSIANKWNPNIAYVRKAIYFKESKKVLLLDFPIALARLLQMASMHVEPVRDEKKFEYNPTWDVEAETVELVIYGCKVTIEITSRGEGDVKRGIEWVKRALQLRLDALRKAMEEE